VSHPFKEEHTKDCRTYTGPRTKELLIQVSNEEGSAGEEGVEEDNVS